ncbi:MAG: DUF4296 domain-containing protein [Bacteroidales bacterium]|nr:DUF4296 domain-containing protein [Bacteroidales bacterium]
MGKWMAPALFMILAATACGPDTAEKPDRELLIPDDELVAVLTDLYLAGGVLEVPEVRSEWGYRDSITNYMDVIDNHGLTYKQLEATMQYYFSAKPKKMARIYDRVTGNLLKLEVLVQTQDMPSENLSTDNLWLGKYNYSLPEDFAKDPIWFDVPVDGPGTYILKADIQVYADDKSLDPRVTVFFSTVDSLGAEVRDMWDEVSLKKDDNIQYVEVSKKIESGEAVHIKGWLLNHTAQQGLWEKHARIRNISLRLEKENIAPER